LQKKQRGKPFKQYLRGSKEIRPNKIAVFFQLAEKSNNGGWLPPRKNVSWINIPDKNDKTFTQIQLNKEDDSYFENSNENKNTEWAVFMHKKGMDGVYAYYFYGIFKREHIDERGICIFCRMATSLKTADW
jgi:hypothetical protein